MSDASDGQPTFHLRVNGRGQTFTGDADTPLLWVLREALNLKGTKYGCGIARCGACTVLMGDLAVRSCVKPIRQVTGDITTIEGLEQNGALHPVQRAWLCANVPQCGYCQSGQIMATVALLRHTPRPLPRDVDLALSGNLCRCGTYPRIRQAIERLTNMGGLAAGPPYPPALGAPRQSRGAPRDEPPAPKCS